MCSSQKPTSHGRNGVHAQRPAVGVPESESEPTTVEMMMNQRLANAMKVSAHTGPDGHLGPLAQLPASKDNKTVSDSVKEEILVKLAVRGMNTKRRLVMLETVCTTNGQHSPHAVLPVREENNQGLVPTHAELVKQKLLTATLIQEHTTYGPRGQPAPRHAGEVCNPDDVIILAVKMIKLKVKSAIQIQVRLANGLHGVAAQLHAGEVHRLHQECTHVLEKHRAELKNATLILALSGVDGHSGDFVVPPVTKEQGFDIDNVEVVQSEVVSALVAPRKYKFATPGHAVISPGEDGVLAVCKEGDKCNSNFVEIGAKMNGPTERVIALLQGTEELILTVWITTSCLQRRC